MNVATCYVCARSISTQYESMQYTMRRSSNWSKHQTCKVYLLTRWHATYSGCYASHDSYTQDCILQVDYHQLWIIRDRIMPLLEIYCTFSFQSVVYLHVFRLFFLKRRFELFFYMLILLTLLLQTVYFFNCYFSETFLELTSLTKATTSISHLWNSLNLCGESKYHNRYICHPFIHSFWMFKVIKRGIYSLLYCNPSNWW